MTSHSEHYWIEQLGLEPHPEGGFFKQLYKSDQSSTTWDNRDRPYYTSIYFLLNQVSPSHFHRLKSDEIWYYHTGDALTVHMIHPNGTYEAVKLGLAADKGEVLQYVVPKGTIFGSSVESEKSDAFSLVSCMVSPGFEYHDFELFTQAELLNDYPDHKDIIEQLAFEVLPEV
ncbi:cupin domain-containing protein [Desemzia sp. RIT804]|uniref:cupin domain-containing protein n=1 Tax=Desemzia sp. RIT 804 TaxID=2810209 RepID=UPI00194EE3AF|nr:cupin domain-containing protein [Desemzia sp. RIT 804]MBM6615401.1 cupin domain-containing protein [Desemzia sp. RIT 804]